MTGHDYCALPLSRQDELSEVRCSCGRRAIYRRAEVHSKGESWVMWSQLIGVRARVARRKMRRLRKAAGR